MLQHEHGNALMYVLVAVGLLAALTFAISDDNRGQQAGHVQHARVSLLADQILEHAIAAEQAVYQMAQWGANYDTMKFDLPGSVDYDTDTVNQIYHPAGGGLQAFNQSSEDLYSGGNSRGWQFQNKANVEWSPSASTDLIYSFVDINADICARLNDRLHGSPTIPVATVTISDTFIDNATNADLVISECADCERMKSLCIRNGTTHVFYNIIGSR